MDADVGRRGEEWLLRLSVGAAVAFAVVALVWGVLVGSQLIVFDGLYSSISVALSALSLAAYRAIRRGPDDLHPFGREILSSLVVIVKGVAIAVLCLYALAGAILDLLGGGREVAAGWAVGYAAAATLGCGATVWLLRRDTLDRGPSELLRAEAAQWLLDTLLSAAILVGFVVALVFELRGQDALAAYVDPAMVAVVSLWFLRLPVQLVRSGYRGVVAVTPPAAVVENLHERVAEVVSRHGFADQRCRVATFGERLDVEIDLLVGDAATVTDARGLDQVRDELELVLAAGSSDIRMTVSMTADPHRMR